MAAKKKNFDAISPRNAGEYIQQMTAAPEDDAPATVEAPAAAPAPELTQDEAQDEAREKKARRPRKTYTQEQVDQFVAENRTRGRKGARRVRINMAFTPDVHEYIRVMSRYLGMTMTDFTDLVFKFHMEANEQLYDEVQRRKETFLF